jgi:hypothetical protein
LAKPIYNALEILNEILEGIDEENWFGVIGNASDGEFNDQLAILEAKIRAYINKNGD